MPAPLTPRAKLGLAFLLLAGGVAATFILIGLIVRPALASLPALPLVLAASMLVLGLLLLVVWAALDRRLIRPVMELTEASRQLLLGKPPPPLSPPRISMLDELSENMGLLAADLQQSRQDINRSVASGAAGLQDEQKRLQAVLSDMDDGALICDREGGILLFNRTAAQLHGDDVRPGRSIYELWARAALEQNVRALQRPRATTSTEGQPGELSEFLCATLERGELMRCRVRLLPASAALRPGFLITFRPASDEANGLMDAQPSLQAAVEALRSPLASLRAAAENLVREQDMDEEDRQRFQSMIVRESRELSQRVDWISETSQRFLFNPAHMADVLTSDMLLSVRLAQQDGIRLPHILETGHPLWLHADGYAIRRLLLNLLHHLRDDHHVGDVEAEALLGDRRIYIDLRWRGEPTPVTVLDQWLGEPLAGSPENLTGRMVLENHGSVCWSQWDRRRSGISTLRIPLPAARGQRNAWAPAASYTSSSAPSLSPMRRESGDQRPRPLSDSSLFDLGHTALAVRFTPADSPGGLPVLSEFAARRVVKGRRVPGTGLHLLLGDGSGKVPLDEALLRLHAFSRGTALVGHETGPIMQFLHMHQAESGARFEHPVLDIALLSALLHDHTADHSFESLIWRMGLERPESRPSVADDADGVADIFCRMLPLLRQRGIERVSEAVEACRQLMTVQQAGGHP
ncbi:MAG: hypothetical protein LAT50_21185 [Ectothiorhodospiraceae bacterium]|nr:hypothetical protein [Ectothiorhodospiraceae bacterium]